MVQELSQSGFQAERLATALSGAGFPPVAKQPKSEKMEDLPIRSNVRRRSCQAVALAGLGSGDLTDYTCGMCSRAGGWNGGAMRRRAVFRTRLLFSEKSFHAI